MIKLKGTTLYPPAIFEILNQVSTVADYAIEVYNNDLELDDLKIYVVSTDGRQAESALKAAFQSRLRIVPEIIFYSQSEMDAFHMGGHTRKLQRFIDRRK